MTQAKFVKLSTILALLLAFGMLASFAGAMSPNEAIDYVSKKNQFLLDGEGASILQPQVMISYSGKDYWVVTGITDSNPTIYLPINNSEEIIANGAIEARELIKTEIVLWNLYKRKNSFPVGDWPFSYNTETMFSEFESKFKEMSPKITSVATELEGITSTQSSTLRTLAKNTATKADLLANESKELGQLVDEAREFEEKFLTDPDTNKVTKLENYYSQYFMQVESLSSNYSEFESNINSLKQGIAQIDSANITSTQRNLMLSNLAVHSYISAKLPSFTSNTPSIKTIIEGIFTSAKNVEPLTANLNTRILRNDAWIKIYGQNDSIFKLNSAFTSVYTAAEAILSEDNVDLWKEQDTVESLKSNWTQAKNKYTSGEYEKASSFAETSAKNIKVILEGGAKEVTDTFSQELITQIIVVLIVGAIGLFVFDKMYWQKKKKKGEEDEDYERSY